MNPIFGGGRMDLGGHFIRSRFIRSLKKESMEPMDGGLYPPPSLFRSRWLKLTQNGWERMGTDGLSPA